MLQKWTLYGAALAVQVLVLAPAAAQYAADPAATQQVMKGRPYSPYADRAFPTDVYFGDTHVHTALSADAGGGGTKLLPRDAYRFARGEQVVSNTGQPVKLSRPLDFYMITDHSDGMGVPMGADLPAPTEGAKAPTFLVYALRDPIGANLDRIQIIKGWLDADGNPRERVYDVAWCSDRTPDANGKLPPIDDTVDLDIPSWTNTIGASELGTVWTDPDFDPRLRAFYYARVIEIPTPRWTAYDRVKFELDLPEDIPLKTQERAYTSPIWYTPAPDEPAISIGTNPANNHQTSGGRVP